MDILQVLKSSLAWIILKSFQSKSSTILVFLTITVWLLMPFILIRQKNCYQKIGAFGGMIPRDTKYHGSQRAITASILRRSLRCSLKRNCDAASRVMAGKS